MKHLLKDFFNFERKRNVKEAAIFLIFHSFIALALMSVIQLFG